MMGGGGGGPQTRATEIVPRGRHRPEPVADDYDGYDDGEEERRRKRKRAWITTIVTLVVVALVVLGIYLVTTLLGNKNNADGNFAQLPDVKGKTESEARTTLNQAGFTKYVFNPVNCEPGPGGAPAPCGPEQVGRVIDQDPPSGQADKTSQVKLTVGRTATPVKVPDVKGKSREDAAAKLQEAGFTTAPEDGQEAVTDSKLVGKVSSTIPAANTDAPKGSAIKLNIGKTPEPVPVPDVTKQDFATAKANLESEGWTVSRSDVENDQPAGIVIDYAPKKAKPGSAITLKVSKGPTTSNTPGADQIQMPNLVGLKVKDAQNLMRSKGWDGQINQQSVPTNDPTQDGEIEDQDPDAGLPVGKNGAINVKVSKFGPGGGG
jgi:serine/threonine-protein kinase